MSSEAGSGSLVSPNPAKAQDARDRQQLYPPHPLPPVLAVVPGENEGNDESGHQRNQQALLNKLGQVERLGHRVHQLDPRQRLRPDRPRPTGSACAA